MRLIVRSEIPHVGDDGTLGADRGARSGVVEVAKRPELPACPRLAARQIVRIVFPVLDLSVLVEADLQYHGRVGSPRDNGTLVPPVFSYVGSCRGIAVKAKVEITITCVGRRLRVNEADHPMALSGAAH